MKSRIESEQSALWRIVTQEHGALLRIVIEVEIEFLEEPKRVEFDHVGQEVANALHDLYRELKLWKAP